MSYERCISEIQAAGGGKLTEDDISDILDEILKRKNRRSKAPGLSEADRVFEAAQEYGRTLEEMQAILERAVHENAAKRIARRAVQAGAPDPALGIEAGLVGVNAPFAGSRDSVELAAKTLRADWLVGLELDLRKAGLKKYAATAMDDTDVARELAELNKRKGAPGVTGNARARELAGILFKWQRASLDAANRAGAWAKLYDGYVSRTVHTPSLVRGVSDFGLLLGRAPSEAKARLEWSQFVLNHADLDRTFGGRDQALKALPALWREFSTGEHLTDLDPDQPSPIRGFGANQGRKLSAAREIHWKSAADWAAYNAKYGAGSTVRAVIMHLQAKARSTALMQKLGTHPEAALRADIDHWRQDPHLTERQRKALNKAEAKLNNQLALLDGRASRPVDQVSAARLSAWMRGQRLAKLGSAGLTTILDLPTKAAELRYEGVGFFERWSSMLHDYLGRAGLSGDAKDAADILKAGFDGEIASIADRFEGGSFQPGLASTAEQVFFTLTGVKGATDNQRLGFAMMAARNVGKYKNRPLSELPRGLPHILRGLGIDNSTWDLLRAADWRQVGKRDFFSADLVDRIPADRLAMYAGGRDVADVAAELKQRILSFTHDRAHYAVIEPGVREQALMYGGHQPGTFWGNTLRLFWQFKSFSVAMLDKTWGRSIYGGGSATDRMAGIAELLIASWVFGYAAMTMRDFLYGRTPRDPRDPQTLAAAFAAGGGLSIYGDFLFGSWSRYGASAGDSLLGPTFGQFSSAMDLFSQWKSGESGKADVLKLVKQNMPLQNFWLTRTAFDHYVMHRMQEAMSPGYLERMESRVRDANGGWWLPPTSALQ